jgi:predicted SnoaL-like aldol condensation-catalyzing enzyme|tara:strand:+ start:1802 stop:2017 length:216 start_codon:yes stop_codon:yes gene_type:complete
MKKLFITALVAFFTINAFSQANSEIELMQKIFGLEKLQIVSAYVNPGEEHTVAFIDLYEEYEEKRMEHWVK